MPYNVETVIPTPGDGYVEVMRPGVFSRSLVGELAVPLMSWHERRMFPLGVSAHLDETPDGLVGVFRLTERSAYAATAWHHIVDGSLSGLSVGFRPVVTDWTLDKSGRPARAERVEAELYEVSACPVPAYPSARITSHVDTGAARPNLDAALAWLDEVRHPACVC